MKKSMVKRLALMIMFVISFSFILAGCNLFERNWYKYYNAVVVSIEYPDGDVVEINKRELITAFNNYGANLVNNYGQSYQTAMENTLNQLINQKILLKQSQQQAQLTNADKNKLYTDTIKSINDYFTPLVEEVKKDWQIKDAEVVEQEEQEQDVVLYKPYQKKVEIVTDEVTGNFVLRLLNPEAENQEQLKHDFMQDVYNKSKIVDKLYEYVASKSTFTSENQNLSESEKLQQQNARVFKEATRRLIDTLKTSEQGMKLSTDDQGVLKRALEKFYQNNLESLLLSKIEDIITPTSEYSKITVNQVLETYKNLVSASFEKYSVDADALVTDMLDNYSSVNYYQNFSRQNPEQNQQFFFVSHILLQFSEQDKSALEELDAKRTLGGTGEIGELEYKQEVDKILKRVTAQQRDQEGKIIESPTTPKYASDIVQELNLALEQAQTNQAKAQAFRDLMYKYNQDPGALNSEYLYVIGTKDSRMDENFTKASRELHQNREFGGVSGLVRSSYGLHIVFYAGDVADYMPFQFSSLNNFSLKQEDILTLDQTLLNPLSNKTVFDKVFETMQEQTSSNNQRHYLNVLKKDLVIKKHTSNYKDLIN